MYKRQDTALHRITTALDQISSTAASHQRSFVVAVSYTHLDVYKRQVLLERGLAQWAWAAPYSKEAATLIVIASIGVVSMLFGALVPKRIGLIYPEAIARWSARPMLWVCLLYTSRCV